MKIKLFKTNPWIVFLVFLIADIVAHFVFFDANNVIYSVFPLIVLYFIWVFYVYLGISFVDKEFNNNRFSLSFPIVLLISISSIIINLIISTTFPISVALYVIAFATLLFCYVFIIKKIVKLEKNKKAEFTDYLDLGLSLIIYLIGWYDIQRRIRRVILRKEKSTD